MSEDTERRARSAALVERLNAWWRIGGPDPEVQSAKYRLAAPLRKALARLLGPQETFNSLLVQYVNETVRPLEDLRDELRDHHADLEAAREEIQNVRRFQEALAARERRMDQAMAAMRTEHDEIRAALNVLRQTNQGLVRQLTQAGPTPAAGARTATPAAPVPAPAPAAGTAAANADALTDAYVGFEDAFRGSPEAIRAGLAGYVDDFAGATDVLDIGCGRGEFLALLGERGITARGIDLNDAMVGVCRERGLDASRTDALSYLRAQAPGSLGGLFAAQVVEHLEPSYLTQLLAAAYHALRPGAPIVLETINPACWFAFFESYVRDITHVRPLHPDTLKVLLVANGFERVDIRYRAPYPEHEKLQPLPEHGALGDASLTFNANVEKINRLLFTYLDYAAIGRRA
jgi:SAM-dependent methyltransferase